MNPPSNIRNWLEGIGLAELTVNFEENHITPDVLHTLDVDDLREMGITSLGHRKRLLMALAALNAREAPPAPPEPAPEPQPAPQAARNPQPAPQSHRETQPPPPRAPRASPPVPPGPQLVPLKAAPPVVREVATAPAPAPETPLPVSDPQPEPPPSAAGKKHRRRAFSASFMTVSICLHLVVAIGAGYWVVQRIEAKRKLQFASGPPTSNPNKRALEHKVSLQKKKNAGGSPAQAKRISVTGLAAKITLPEMPAVPTTSTQFVAGRMAGMGGAGFGSGLGFGNGSGMGVGGAGAGGLGLTMFGARGGAGLTGTFYDLKRDKHGRGNGMVQNHDLYGQVLRGFTSGSNWQMPPHVNCYTGRSRLVAKAFIFPAIPDTEAGKAFNEPATGAGMWLAHYSGSVTPSVSGRYRFVGWGDNVLFVRLGSKTVLDASDLAYLGAADIRVNRGAPVSFPNKPNTPLVAGSWFDVTAGKSIKMEVLIGDEGGIFCAGLLLEKEGVNAGSGKHNIPDLPIFLAAPLGIAEKRLYDDCVSPDALKGPVFHSSSGGGNPLDILKR